MLRRPVLADVAVVLALAVAPVQAAEPPPENAVPPAPASQDLAGRATAISPALLRRIGATTLPTREVVHEAIPAPAATAAADSTPTREVVEEATPAPAAPAAADSLPTEEVVEEATSPAVTSAANSAPTGEVVQAAPAPAAPTATNSVESPSTSAQSGGSQAVSIDLAVVREALGTSRSSTVFGGGSAPKTLGNAVQKVALEMGQILSVPASDRRPYVAIQQGTVEAASPTVLYTIDDGGVTRALALVYRSHDLVWNPSSGAFVGSLLVGLIDREHPGTSAKIPTPVPVQLLPSGQGLVPDDFSLDQVGGRFFPVRISLQNPDDPYTVRLISPVDPDLPDASLRLHRTPAVITASPHIDGLGIGSTDIVVRGRSGRLTPGEPITLTSSDGELENETIAVGANGIAGTRLRSTGLGAATVALATGPYIAPPVTVEFLFPLVLMTAAVLGAMLGAGIFVYALARSGRGSTRNHVVDWLIGVSVGLGATAMLYAGMKLPDWIPKPTALTGAVVPFAVAFVCAAMGAALITYLTGFRQSVSPART